MEAFIEDITVLIQRGGYVMVPLLAFSVISMMLVIERSLFWMSVHGSASSRRRRDMTRLLRAGDRKALKALVAGDNSPYAVVARQMLKEGATDAVALESIELQRPRLERYMVTLSTIISAAPLLGILGTVIGIIQSFNLLGELDTLTDPSAVSVGIAEALLTTAMGLVVALFTLFPYMIFKGHLSRSMGHLESVVAAAQQPGAAAPPRADAASSADRAKPAAT